MSNGHFCSFSISNGYPDEDGYPDGDFESIKYQDGPGVGSKAEQFHQRAINDDKMAK